MLSNWRMCLHADQVIESPTAERCLDCQAWRDYHRKTEWVPPRWTVRARGLSERLQAQPGTLPAADLAELVQVLSWAAGDVQGNGQKRTGRA